MSSNCRGCGAPIQSEFVCAYCGAGTGRLAETEEQEFAMLREVGRAAQSVPQRARSEAMARGGMHAARHAKEASDEALAMFLSSAPIPKTPAALRQACLEAFGGYTGQLNDWFDVQASQAALLHRAETMLSTLAALGDAAGDLTALQRLGEQKGRLATAKSRFKFYYFGGLFAGLLLLPVILAIVFKLVSAIS